MAENKNVITVTNDSYVLDEDKDPVWYVFVGAGPELADGEVGEHYTVVIGPSTTEEDVVKDFVATEVEGGDKFTLSGVFDHEPTEAEKQDLIPEGFEIVEG